MSLATGSRVQLLRIQESVYGTTPATPTMIQTRRTGDSIELSRQNLQSAEIRSDREIADFRLGTYTVKGDMDFELIYGEYDDILAVALSNVWSNETVPVNGTISSVSSGSLAGATYYARSTIVYSSGETAPAPETSQAIAANHVPSVASPSAPPTPTGSPAPTVTGWNCYMSSAPGTETLQNGSPIAIGTPFQLPNSGLISGAALPTGIGNTLVGGVTKNTFSIEKGFLDIGKYMLFKGCNIDTFHLEAKPTEIVKCKASIFGQNMVTASSTAASAITASLGYSPFDAFTGTINEGNSPIAIVTSIDFDVKNQDEAAFVIGNKLMVDYFPGRRMIEGNIEAWFQDLNLYNKFLNETETEIDVTFGGTKPADATLNFKFPRVKYTTGKVDVTQERGIPIKMGFQVLLDSVTNHSIIVTRNNPTDATHF